MDFGTIIGLILGVIIIAASLLMGGVPVQTIIHPEAILIVFGGTLTALLINYSPADIHESLFMVFKAFREDDLAPETVIDYIVDAAIYIRSKGLLAVQPLLDYVDIPYLQTGLQMIVDNQSTDHIRAQLQTELEVTYRRENQLAKVYETAGGFAPTMGIIGAIIGLIEIMNLLKSPEQLGHGIAQAFIATLYGVGAANLFLLPIAGKLKQRAKDEWFLKSIMLHGILSIREGHHPNRIKEELDAYLGFNSENVSSGETYPEYETAIGVS